VKTGNTQTERRKIMNPVMSFVSIVALLLALGAAGNIATEQAEVNPSAARQINPSKIALNHNETMVSDAVELRQSQLLTSVHAFPLSRPIPGDCDDWMCGMNHNETMVSDAPLAQDANLWSRWLKSVQALFLSRPIPGGCDEFGCGSNHNETLERDTNS
jgi:hypothetical protein